MASETAQLVITSNETPPTIISASIEFCKMSGSSFGALVGQPLSKALMPADGALLGWGGAFPELFMALQSGRSFFSPGMTLKWPSGNSEFVEVRASPLYDEQTGAHRHFLLTFSEPQGRAEVLPDADEVQHSSSLPPAMVEGVRNVAGEVQQLLEIADSGVAPPTICGGSSSQTAWAVLYASILHKSMFENLLLTRPRQPDAADAAAPAAAPGVGGGGAAGPSSSSSYEIWHMSAGLEELLGYKSESVLGRDVTMLCAPADAPSPLPEQVRRPRRRRRPRPPPPFSSVLPPALAHLPLSPLLPLRSQRSCTRRSRRGTPA